MYGERIRDLKRDPSIRDILVTRRHRAPGSRITHPYSRLTAIPIIFDEVRRKLRECREHYEYKRRCVYCDMHPPGDRGRGSGGAPDRSLPRPVALRGPLALRDLDPARASTTASTRGSLSGEVVADLAGILGGLFRTLAAKLGDPAFEMTLYTAPNLAAKILPGEWSTIADDYHWHIEVCTDPRSIQRGRGNPRQRDPARRRPPSSSGTPGSEPGRPWLNRRKVRQQQPKSSSSLTRGHPGGRVRPYGSETSGVGYNRRIQGRIQGAGVLRFTKRADYGLMAIHFIASHGDDGAVSAKRIAEEFHIPPERLAKILQRLAKKKLITSHNGPKGGYVLTRRPGAITVGQVVRALEGPAQRGELHDRARRLPAVRALQPAGAGAEDPGQHHARTR